MGREVASVGSGLGGWKTGGTFDVICVTVPSDDTIIISPYIMKDLSDEQWRSFRSTLPLMSVVFVLLGLGSRALGWWSHQEPGKSVGCSKLRLLYLLVFSFIFLFYLHGFCALYVIWLVTSNWLLSQLCLAVGTVSGKKSRRIASVAAIWIFNIIMLLLVRITDGFLASRMPEYLRWLDVSLVFQYNSRGLFRWEICYNLTMLRMISFSLDSLWSSECHDSDDSNNNDDEEQEDEDSTKGMKKMRLRKKPSPSRGGGVHAAVSSYEDARRVRRSTSVPLHGYLCCLVHALYPPLYVAGPIITYNDFMWQIVSDDDAVAQKNKVKVASTRTEADSWRDIVKYSFRCVCDILVMEILTHYMYFNAIAVHKVGFRLQSEGLDYGALDVATTGWWVLAFMWLKFTIIWRVFRLAALIEGIDAPENMKRCFAMNYDIQGFWKNWHASYNQWLVRYMYLPTGGSKYQMFMIWPIFFFVAMWHDVEWRLLGWASLMCLAFLPEILIKQECRRSRWDWLKAPAHDSIFQGLCGVVAAVNIAALMCGNMVGFVVGVDGLLPLLREMLSSPALILVSLLSFYCAARLMFVLEKYIYA